jgi:excisionase family DNA binding protein
MAGALSDMRFLTVAEVAEMMRVSTMTVYRLVKSGELPAVRFGRSYRIPETAVEAAVELPNAQSNRAG